MNEIFDRLTDKWGPRRFMFELSRNEEHYLDDAEFLQKFRRRGYSVTVEYVQADHSMIMACKCCPEHNLTNRRAPLSTQGSIAETVATSSPGVMLGVERTSLQDSTFFIPAGAPPPQQANGVIYVRARDMGQYIVPDAITPPAPDGAVCMRRSDAEELLRWFERNYP